MRLIDHVVLDVARELVFALMPLAGKTPGLPVRGASRLTRACRRLIFQASVAPSPGGPASNQSMNRPVAEQTRSPMPAT